MTNLDLKILCVDDEVEILNLFAEAVKAAGYTPLLCSDPVDAIAIFKTEQNNIALILSDYMMPSMNGFEFRKGILPTGLSVPFVIVSSFVTKEMALTALDLKIAAFVDKPVSESSIAAIIAKESKERVDFIRESQALEATFIEESMSILEEIDPVLLSMDQDRSNQDSINLLFRGAHTIKGSSGILATDIVTRYVHKYEDIISAVKKGQIPFTDDVYETLLKGVDRIKELVAAVAAKEIQKFKLEDLLPELSLDQSSPIQKTTTESPSAPSTIAKAGASTPKPKDNISVPTSMLDELSAQSGEITVIRNMVNKLVRSLERKYVGNKEIQSLGELLDEMHKINSVIQNRITDLRKVPLSGVLKPLPRIIRDLARDLKKSIHFQIEGDAIRVDKSLAAVCSNSLVHLVRNSADHGIETASDREKSNKSPTGAIQLRCVEHRDEIEITITDDGKGINPTKIKEKALEKNLFTESQLNEMTDLQALNIIFAAGFSTAAKITDVSGRGVGMDMVRSSVESVGGHIQIESKAGFGSTFRLKLPIPKSVLIINSLTVDAGGRLFAVPQDAIKRVIRIHRDQYDAMVQDAASGLTLRSDDQLFPLVALSKILGMHVASHEMSPETNDVVEVLLLNSEVGTFALKVDAILDSEEIVVKNIAPYINPLGAFSGVTFMGDGSLGLILDVKGIAELADLRQKKDAMDSSSRTDLHHNLALSQERKNYLIFNLGTKALYGVPLDQVFRLEEIDRSQVQYSGEERVVIYRDVIMPLQSVHRLLQLSPVNPPLQSKIGKNQISTIVAKSKSGYIGLEVDTVIDIGDSDLPVSDIVRDRKGVAGNIIIRDQNVTILDLHSVLSSRACS